MMRTMELDFETLLRYGIPGAILLLPLIITLITTNQAGANDTPIILLVFIMVPLGYIAHQIWVLAFETLRGGYYKNRPNLQYIQQQNQTTTEEAYLMWEYWIYLNADKLGAIFNRSRRLWQFYHSNMTDALSLLLGTITNTLLTPASPIKKPLTAIYLTLMILFTLKAHNLKKETNQWELHIAKQNTQQIKQQNTQAYKPQNPIKESQNSPVG